MNNNTNNTNIVNNTNTVTNTVANNATNQVAPVIVYKKVRSGATIFLLLVIACLFGACYFFNKEKNDTINYYKNVHSPINTSEEKKLEVDSTLVQMLYNRVKTTALEDIANPEFDDNLKRYLAYRNLGTDDFYHSTCNLFKSGNIKYFDCDDKDFVPYAFKEESLMLKYKEIFGEEYLINHASVQLGYTCLGGYEYIPRRKEYVQGKCTKNDPELISVEKSLDSASSTEDIIKINEKVRYYQVGGNKIPSTLKNGMYTYTFRLDKNFNYIFVSKELTDGRG